ncbi:MAG: hypothetical protein ACOVKV_17985, partial [Novosphingobium sp.]
MDAGASSAVTGTGGGTVASFGAERVAGLAAEPVVGLRRAAGRDTGAACPPVADDALDDALDDATGAETAGVGAAARANSACASTGTS